MLLFRSYSCSSCFRLAFFVILLFSVVSTRLTKTGRRHHSGALRLDFNPPLPTTTPAATTKSTTSPTTPATTTKPTTSPPIGIRATTTPTTATPTTPSSTKATTTPTTTKPTTTPTTTKPTTTPTTTKATTTAAPVKPTTAKPTQKPTTPTTPSRTVFQQLADYLRHCNFSELISALPPNVSNVNWNTTEITRSLSTLLFQLGEITTSTSCRPLQIWTTVISFAFFEMDCSKPIHASTCEVENPTPATTGGLSGIAAARPVDPQTVPPCTKNFCSQNPGDFCRTKGRLGVCNETSTSCPVSCIRLAGVDDASLNRSIQKYQEELSLWEEMEEKEQLEREQEQQNGLSDTHRKKVIDSEEEKVEEQDSIHVALKRGWSSLVEALTPQNRESRGNAEGEDTEEASDLFLPPNLKNVNTRNLIDSEAEEQKKQFSMGWSSDVAANCVDHSPLCVETCVPNGIIGEACFVGNPYANETLECCYCDIKFAY